jgi:hypothetical protein
METSFMTLSRRFALLGLMCLLPTAAVQAESGTGDSRALIAIPFEIYKIEDLAFGTLIPTPIAGTATIDPAGARTVTGGVVAAGGTIGAARFTGVGTAGQLALISFPTGATSLARVGGGATMTMDQMTIDSGLVSPGSAQRTIPANRQLDIYFGGRLVIGASQMEGLYQGTFDITVDYL